jgi:hypothetical protein
LVVDSEVNETRIRFSLFPLRDNCKDTAMRQCSQHSTATLRTSVFPSIRHALNLLPFCYPSDSQQSSTTMTSPSNTAGPSSNFKSMLDAALAEYKKKTGNDLLAHWLASELQACDSVDTVLDILRDQAKAFERSDDQKLMKWIDPLVHVLHTFSDALGDGVSLVLINIHFMTI